MKLKGNSGFKLVELLVVCGILTLVMAGVYMVLGAARSSWATAETQIQIQGNLRLGLEKVFKELRESGEDSTGTMQLTISNGTGVNNSDVIKFSVPVTCTAGASIIDANGDVAYWGAPLTWGCTSSTCMDADSSCNTLEYKFLEYKINSSNQLLRSVLDAGSTQVRQDIIAYNITDFQASLSADQNVVTLTATGSTNSALNRQITIVNSIDVYLRNKG